MKKVQGSIKTKVKGILAKMDTKVKKKQYKKSKSKVDDSKESLNEKPGIKIAEFPMLKNCLRFLMLPQVMLFRLA